MRVIVHVGVPKTAGRSLRAAYFPAVAAENPGILWAGALEPRRRRPSALYGALLEALTAEGREGCFRQELARIQARTVILSCPHVLAEHPGLDLSWKTKLARLGRALAGTDHRLIVTVRDPLDAAFAYYAALVHLFPRRGRRLVVQAGTERFEVFRYARLFAVLHAHVDPERVDVVGFDDIVHGRLDAMDAATDVARRARALPHLGKPQWLDGAIRADRLSVEESIAYVLPRFVMSAAQPLVDRIPEALRGSVLGNRPLVPGPTTAEMARLADYYAPHVAHLRARFGIENRRELHSRRRPDIGTVFEPETEEAGMRPLIGYRAG